MNKNFLIPNHKKLTGDECQDILKKYKISSSKKLPKIKIKDPSIIELEVEANDIIEITRNSYIGETKYYRVVIK